MLTARIGGLFNMKTSSKKTLFLVVMAFFVALQVVVARVVSIEIGNVFRINFAFIVSALCGALLGPIPAATCGVLADFAGYLVRPIGVYHPGFAFTAALVGFVYGYFLHKKRPIPVKNIVIAAQHSPDVELEKLRRDIKKHVIDPIIPENFITEETEYFINATGRFVLGGPLADAGLTGRKIIVDTYGGYARHGGGAFSGKDLTKVDRSASYAARYVAKNIVAAGLADKCEVGLSYVIGVAKPLSIYVETFGTGKISDNEIEKLVQENFDLRPAAIIKELDLLRPIYRQVASYGHFGRDDLDLPWEKTDKADLLRR